MVTIPIVIEIFLLYDEHRIELMRKALIYVLARKNQDKCQDFFLTTCEKDHYPYLRRILNPIEEFNLNLLFLISIFVDLLITNNNDLRNIVLPFLFGLLIINRKMSMKACKACHQVVESKKENRVLKHFYNRSVLLYSFLILGLTFIFNFTIFSLFS